nr:torsin-1A isoform X1 [Aedes albopictus]
MIPARSILVLQGLLVLISFSDAFDPISATIGLGIAAGVGVKWKDQIADYTLCQFYECCRKPYLKSDVEGLKLNLTQHLFGQHIVQDVLVNAIGAHFDTIELSRKPLVMSFHGTSGVGKTYVSQFIASSMFQKAQYSRFVHRFPGRIPFTTISLVESYKIDLQHTILNSLRQCPESLFIFDDVEEIPSGIVNYIVHMLNHNVVLDGVSLSKAMFVFITNVGGVEISNILLNMLKNGKTREEADYYDFERALQLASYKYENTGFFRSHLVDSHVVDYYIPFLPLEASHVRSCIMQEFSLYNITKSQIDEDILRMVMKHVTFEGIFVNGGCKRISKKVAAIVRDHFLHL